MDQFIEFGGGGGGEVRFFLWKECHCLLFCALNAWKPVIHLDPRWLLGPRADVDFHSLCKLSNYTGFFLSMETLSLLLPYAHPKRFATISIDAKY